MNKSGLAFKVERNNVILITETGEFVEVRITNKPPKIGENYTGAAIKGKNSVIKNFIIAAAALIMLLSGGSAYAYFTPVSTVLVEINPLIEIKVNRINRIIEVTAMNTDGEILLETLELNNYKLEEALILVVEEAKKKNFINDQYISDGKTISVEIIGGKSLQNDVIYEFKKYIENEKLNININNNGENTTQQYNKINENKKEIQEDEDRNDVDIQENSKKENIIEENKKHEEELKKEDHQKDEEGLNKEESQKNEERLNEEENKKNRQELNKEENNNSSENNNDNSKHNEKNIH